MVALVTRSSLISSVNLHLKRQTEQEEEYWKNVLRRVLATVKFLAREGLAFRGSNENLNSHSKGNYLSCLTYLAEFDEFLAEHLRRYGNKGTGNVSYLSHHICDEFILIIRDKLLEMFITEIKAAKYFSLILDSTPDISHTDQLSLSVRYVGHEGNIVERFLSFLKIESHTAEYLQRVVLNKLEMMGLDIENCRGQSYDNAANMSGKYNGLQAKIKSLSPTASYAPCTNHSLNLALNFACETSLQVVDYFTVVQMIYTFFSASTLRWKKLLGRCNPVPKRLSDTRWSARYDAVHALVRNYKTILEIILEFSADDNEKPAARNEALAIAKKMETFEILLLTNLWSHLLERINGVTKSLESPKLSLIEATQLLKSLADFVDEFRGKFDEYERMTELKTDCKASYQDESRRTRKRKLFADEVSGNEAELKGRNAFKVNVFYVVCDGLSQELRRRIDAYSEIESDFKCFFSSNEQDISDSLVQLSEKYRQDIEPSNLKEEFAHFHILCQNTNTSTIMEKFELAQPVRSTFPNIVTLLEIYLTIPLSNASAERSFSSLKYIKNYLRSTMSQEKLDALSLLYIESESMDFLDTDKLIREFACKKVRKKHMM